MYRTTIDFHVVTAFLCLILGQQGLNPVKLASKASTYSVGYCAKFMNCTIAELLHFPNTYVTKSVDLLSSVDASKKPTIGKSFVHSLNCHKVGIVVFCLYCSFSLHHIVFIYMPQNVIELSSL